MPDRQRRNPQERGGGRAAEAEDPLGLPPREAAAPTSDPRLTPGPPPAPVTEPLSDTAPDPTPDLAPDFDPDLSSDDSGTARRRRRAQFLRELNEAKALRERVKPRQARAARMRQQMRMRTFRW